MSLSHVSRYRSRLLAVSSLLLLSATSATSCTSKDCKDIALFSLSVSVVTPAGSPVCDAVVTATDHDFVEVLQPFPTDRPCRYAGVAERKGTYSIHVAHGSSATSVEGVRVTADDCHVRTAKVTIQLSE